MAFYENTIIAKQDLAEKDIKTLKDKYNEIINSSAGKVIKIEEWGLLNLANKIKNSQKVVIEDSGHMSILETASETKNLLKNFFKNNI